MVPDAMTGAFSRDPVERAIYASLAGSGTVLYSRMEAIRETSVRRNAAEGVHSVLLGLGAWYVQWLEGPAAAVRETLRRISVDPDHRSLQVVHASRGARLLDSPWNMMLLPAAGRPAEVAMRVMALRRELLEGRQYTPDSVLRRIATPFQWPPGTEPGEAEAFHRIGICAATSTPAFSLVRWIAQRQGGAASHRRIAGEDGRDAGLDALDFVHEGQPYRINALPWQGLLQGLLRVYLPDWQMLVLLLSGHVRGDDALVERVSKVLAGLTSGPRVLLCAPDPGTHERAMAQAMEAGIRCGHLATCAPGEAAAIWPALAHQLGQLGPPQPPVTSVPEGVALDF